jgi:hypothetical protein
MIQNRPFLIFDMLRKTGLRRGTVFGGILVVALLAFEIFNYSTTEFALSDLLGNDLNFMGLRWATVLAIAFCGIDFAGIARIFTPQVQASQEPAEVWYLFGAWVLAAAMNATLTWWGVAIAISGHSSLGASIISRQTMLQIVPVFVALLVWLVRLLIIGTFSMAGERMFSMAGDKPAAQLVQSRYSGLPQTVNQPQIANAARPFQKPQPQNIAQRVTRPEPTYQPLGLAAKSRDEENGTWR